MKRFMGIVVLVVLQLGVAIGWLLYGAGKQEQVEERNWEVILTLTSEERRCQEKLALWYNLNLRNSGEGTPRDGYENILFFQDGLMCYVEFPEEQTVLPVWHGAREAQEWGLTHLSRSSLPVGGKGNHTVLTGGGDMVTAKRGDRFYVHTLGDTLIYRVFDVKTTKRDPALTQAEGNRELCSIWIRTDGAWVIIRAARDE